MVSVMLQKAGGDSIHPMGRTIETTMKGSLLGNAIRISTASFSIIDGERLDLMNVSAKSYLLRLTTPCHGFASAAFWMFLSSVVSDCIDADRASLTMGSLTPKNVQSTMVLGQQSC